VKLAVAVGVGLGVLVGVAVCVAVGVGEEVEVGVGVGVGEAVAVNVGQGVRVASPKKPGPAASTWGPTSRLVSLALGASEQPKALVSRPISAIRISQRREARGLRLVA
jgi:hypothetical protein